MIQTVSETIPSVTSEPWTGPCEGETTCFLKLEGKRMVDGEMPKELGASGGSARRAYTEPHGNSRLYQRHESFNAPSLARMTSARRIV